MIRNLRLSKKTRYYFRKNFSLFFFPPFLNFFHTFFSFFLGIPVTALREIVLLRQLEHPNVVKLENVVMDPARLYLVFELVDTGER